MQADDRFETFNITKYAILNLIAVYLTSSRGSLGSYGINVNLFCTFVIAFLSAYLYKINVEPSKFIGTPTREWKLWRTLILLVLPIGIVDFSTSKLIMMPVITSDHKALLWFFSGVVLMPLQTELFRGILIRKFLLKYSVRKTIVLSLVIVSVFSLSPLTGTLIGCVATLVYLKTNSIMNAVVFHMLVKFSVGVIALLKINIPSEAISTYVILSGMSCIAVLHYMYINWPSRRQNPA